MPYDHFEHRHRFAVWAAARAAQRAFARVEVLRDALEQTDIRQFVADRGSLVTTGEEFDPLHSKWCNAIVGHLSRQGVPNATYGRAAKLVAVYLKSMIVLGEHAASSLARVAHPPIDRILLRTMATSAEVESRHKARWRRVAWTTLDEAGYFELLQQLRETLPPESPWWRLEQYWTPASE